MGKREGGKKGVSFDHKEEVDCKYQQVWKLPWNNTDQRVL